MILYLAILALFLLLVHILFNYNEKARLINKIPGPKGSFIVGNAPQLVVSSVELMKLRRVWSTRWKGIFKFWAFPYGAVNIYNPEDIETVLSSVKFNTKGDNYNILTPWLREGLLVSKGDKWQQRRKLLTPAFHFNILREFFVVLRENSQRLVEKLDKSVGESVDVVPILSEFTLHSICETAMGTKLNEEVPGVGKNYKDTICNLGKVFVYRFLRVYLHNDFIFSWFKAAKTMKKYLKIIHSFTEGVIKDRRDYINKYGVHLSEDNDNDDDVVYKKKRKTAMLDLLLMAEKEGHLDTAGIQEEVDTFMFEGHDTTASGLTFCLLCLANNKVIQDKVYKELQEIFGESTRPATMEDLTKMKYLEMCIKESLRLYPPVHFIGRKIHETVVLSGYTVPGDVLCNINILDLHRSPYLYEDPLVFDPDRFLPENVAARHPYAYIPFSAGPRNCIGQKFAMMEMKAAVSEIMRKFELIPVTRHEDIEFITDLILRNIRPVYVTFVKRETYENTSEVRSEVNSILIHS